MKIFRFRDVLPELPRILLQRRLRFKFELIPFEVQGLKPKKIWNFFLAGLNQFLLPSQPLGYPVIAQVEPANFCNLSCPLCLTTSETGSRPAQALSLRTFEEFIAEVGDYLLLIVLWNWGEPFLNPDLIPMIACAKSKNIVVHSSTNGNLKLDDETADRLVESGLDSLVLGIDGATQETYSAYRKGGNLEKVIANIRTIVRAKIKEGSPTPYLTLRFVVMQHNEKELPAAHQLARELGVDFFAVKTVDMPVTRGEDLDPSFAPADQTYQRYEYEAGSFKRKNRPFTCMRPWKRITLGALGEIVPCEYDHRSFHSFGNCDGKRRVLSIWKGAKAQDFRRKFNKGSNYFYLCRDCTYKNSVAEDCTLAVLPLKQNPGSSG